MSILLFLFLLFSVARSCRFWHSVLPRAHFSLCYIYEFHSVCICSSFPGMRRFCLIFLLPHGRCYLLLQLLNSFCVARFARVFSAWEGFGFFVASWRMLYVATFIKFIFHSTFCSSFPGMRRFLLFCYLMADVICCYIILLNSFSIAHFARVFPAWEGFCYFVTSWPMLYVATLFY